MVGSDYYSCDVCGTKTFYDSNVDYEYFNGVMKVICEKCAERHDIVIVNKIVD